MPVSRRTDTVPRQNPVSFIHDVMNLPKIKPKKIKTKIKNPKRVNLRRQQIIDGAIKVFTAKGFYNATVREIADESGITEGTLYNYIRCKEDII